MTLLLTVAICAGILLDLVAFSANAGILWVVLGNRSLRKAPTSVFLLNLCISDILVSLFLIPIAITILFSAFQDDGIYIPTYLCEPVSFINSLLVYSGVWAAAAISVDRRFSIVAPMAHAAFMTTRRALMATGMVWVTAAIFAVLPHIFPTGSPHQLFNYTTSTSSVSSAMILSLVSSSSSTSIAMRSNSTFNMSATATNSTLYVMSYNASTSASVFTETRDECSTWKTCALMFTLDWSNSSHVFAVVIGCYLIPALLMISMYVSIFKVARKAGMQVQKSSTISIPTISGEIEARIQEESEIESEQESTAVGAEESGLHGEENRNCIFRHLFWNDRKIIGDLPYHSPMEPSEEFTCPQCSSKSARRLDASLSDASATKSISAGGKARRTLLLILGLSLASWTPYYVVHAYCACSNDCWKELSDSEFQCSTMPKPGHTSIPCATGCTSDKFPVSYFLYRRSYIVSVVVWLLFLSSALNPILYGLLNRPVREQVLIRATSATTFCYHTVFCCRLCGETSGDGERKQSDEDCADGVEDFLQFLERTSSLSDTPTTRSSILHTDKT